MSRWLRRLAVVVSIALVIVLLRLTVFRPEPIGVTVFEAARGRVESTIVNSRAGTVESRSRAVMSPGLSGLVHEIAVKKGNRVRRGDVLLRLDDEEHRANVLLAERAQEAADASATEACLAADRAQRDLVRKRGLSERNLVSDSELDDAETKAATTEAGCAAARARTREAAASLTAAKATLAKTVMLAPFDGTVLDVSTEVGEWISPSPPGVPIPPVLDLIAPDSLYVSAPIDEADVATIRVGQPVRITLDAFRGRSFEGRIEYVASYVQTSEEQNRTLDVEATFLSNPLPENLLPGLSADIEVILDARENVLRVPSYALLAGDKVLVVSGEKLVERDCEVGLRNWEFAEITSGLAEGDRVVISLDRPEIVAGARVSVEETEP